MTSPIVGELLLKKVKNVKKEGEVVVSVINVEDNCVPHGTNFCGRTYESTSSVFLFTHLISHSLENGRPSVVVP